MKCDEHKSYRAKAKPSGDCDMCWSMWFYAEVQRAQRTTLPIAATRHYLFRAVRNHAHAIEKSMRK